MQGDVDIRKVKQTDMPRVVELWKEFMDFHSSFDTFYSRSRDGHNNFRKWIEKELESDSAELFVADYCGEVIGYIKIQVSQYPPVFQLKEHGMISDAAVAEEYRRKGIGEALYKRAMEWFEDRGIQRVELRVANVNPVASGFWRKMGFRPYMTTMFRET
ncbi:MAG: GNAT family N-acetyltransferase [Candidatus Aegiribacteria sp.]|nr:GNAT family N-acetyltransferase [Candidatus Aegiribacteria sp.]